MRGFFFAFSITKKPSPIIAQIGRGNNISAENYVSRTVEDAGPYNLVNILMRMSLMAGGLLQTNSPTGDAFCLL